MQWRARCTAADAAMPDDTRNHRVYLRHLPDSGEPIFLCRDCWTEAEPQRAIVALGHGKLQ